SPEARPTNESQESAVAVPESAQPAEAKSEKTTAASPSIYDQNNLFKAGESKVTAPLPVYQMGNPFSVGYFTYVVNRVTVQSDANRRFLAVDVTIRNNDDSDTMTPEIELLDENGKLCGSTMLAIAKPSYGGNDLVINLKPEKIYRAYASFEVPIEGKYTLRVSGGLTSGKKALVVLSAPQ